MKIYSFKNNTGSQINRNEICALSEAGTMHLASASTESDAKKMLGVAMYDIDNNSYGEFCIEGFIYYPQGGLTIGKQYYLSEQSGEFTTSIPSGNNFARIIGYALSAYILRFTPDFNGQNSTVELRVFYPTDFTFPSVNAASLGTIETPTDRIARNTIIFTDVNDLNSQVIHQCTGEQNTQAVSVKLRLKASSTQANNNVLFAIAGTTINPGDNSNAIFGPAVNLIVSLPDAEKEYEAITSPITLGGGVMQNDSLIVISITRMPSDNVNDTLPDSCHVMNATIKFNSIPVTPPVPILLDDMSSKTNSESLGGIVDEVTYNANIATFEEFNQTNGTQIDYGQKTVSNASLRWKITDYTANLWNIQLFGGLQTNTGSLYYNLVFSVDTNNKIKIYAISSSGAQLFIVTPVTMSVGDYVLVYDNGKVYLYRDASLIWSDETTLPNEALHENGGNLILGSSMAQNRWATFKIDTFEFYDIALTSSQINQL